MPTDMQFKRATRIWAECRIEGEKIRQSFSPRKCNVAELMENKFVEVIAGGLDTEVKISKHKLPDV